MGRSYRVVGAVKKRYNYYNQELDRVEETETRELMQEAQNYMEEEEYNNEQRQ